VSVQSYYRRALILPVLVPVLATLLLLLGEALPPELIGIGYFLYWSLLIGGIPYLLFAGGFVLWARGRSDREVRRGILLAPLVYAPVLMACFLAFLALDGTPGSAQQVWMLGAFGVLFGYGYVILAELGRVLLRPGLPAEPQPAA
jgi:hypothetical protein